MDISLLFLC